MSVDRDNRQSSARVKYRAHIAERSENCSCQNQADADECLVLQIQGADLGPKDHDDTADTKSHRYREPAVDSRSKKQAIEQSVERHYHCEYNGNQTRGNARSAVVDKKVINTKQQLAL